MSTFVCLRLFDYRNEPWCVWQTWCSMWYVCALCAINPCRTSLDPSHHHAPVSPQSPHVITTWLIPINSIFHSTYRSWHKLTTISLYINLTKYYLHYLLVKVRTNYWLTVILYPLTEYSQTSSSTCTEITHLLVEGPSLEMPVGTL